MRKQRHTHTREMGVESLRVSRRDKWNERLLDLTEEAVRATCDRVYRTKEGAAFP